MSIQKSATGGTVQHEFIRCDCNELLPFKYGTCTNCKLIHVPFEALMPPSKYPPSSVTSDAVPRTSFVIFTPPPSSSNAKK